MLIGICLRRLENPENSEDIELGSKILESNVLLWNDKDIPCAMLGWVDMAVSGWTDYWTKIDESKCKIFITEEDVAFCLAYFSQRSACIFKKSLSFKQWIFSDFFLEFSENILWEIYIECTADTGGVLCYYCGNSVFC